MGHVPLPPPKSLVRRADPGLAKKNLSSARLDEIERRPIATIDRPPLPSEESRR